MATAKKRRVTPVSPELLTLPDRLKAARTTKGLDSTELDDEAGVARGRTSRIEKGKRMANLSADAVLKLCRALGLQVGWLLTGEGEMWRKPSEPPGSNVRPSNRTG